MRLSHLHYREHVSLRRPNSRNCNRSELLLRTQVWTYNLVGLRATIFIGPAVLMGLRFTELAPVSASGVQFLDATQQVTKRLDRERPARTVLRFAPK